MPRREDRGELALRPKILARGPASAMMRYCSIPYLLAALAAAAVSIGAEPKEAARTLRSARAGGTVDRFEVALEVGGTLEIAETASSGAKKPTAVKMNAKAALVYTEKALGEPTSAGALNRSIRNYEKA